jgi:hypothetical protein
MYDFATSIPEVRITEQHRTGQSEPPEDRTERYRDHVGY